MRKATINIARRYDSEDAKRRILSTCVRMYIENGYKNTRMVDVIKAADVSTSTFHNIFHTKDGVLEVLAEFMLKNQFEIARQVVGEQANSVMLYAVETSLQMTISELNENLREIYLIAYTQPVISEYIYHETSALLYKMFGCYLPGYNESDFYEINIGTAAIMRGYMARPCDIYFSLEKKLQRFLRMTLSAYDVPRSEQETVIAHIASLDMRQIALQAMQRLFSALEMKYDFKFTDKPIFDDD